MRNLIADSESLARTAAFVYLSIPLGKLSATQLIALAFATEKYLKQDYINITSNLNIGFGKSNEIDRNALFNYFIKYGLFVIEKDMSVPHGESDAQINNDDKIMIVDFPAEKLTTKQLQRLAELMQLNDIQDIHLINEQEFLFKYSRDVEIGSLKRAVQKIGLTVRTIL